MDFTFREAVIGVIHMIITVLVLGYPLGYMSTPPEFTFIQKFAAGAVLAGMLGIVVEMVSLVIRLKLKLRREGQQRTR